MLKAVGPPMWPTARMFRKGEISSKWSEESSRAGSSFLKGLAKFLTGNSATITGSGLSS